MHEQLLALAKALKVLLLSRDELAEINRLQSQWEHWSERERQHAPDRVAENQAAAFAAFLADPTADNEARLLATADADHAVAVHATMRRACQALRKRITGQAAGIVHPVLDRVVAAFTAEHARRREKAEAVMGSKDRHPAVAEMRRAMDFADKHLHRAFSALNGRQDDAPLALAEALLSPKTPETIAPALTPAARA